MNDKRYRWTLYVITLVIISTIGIQIYWNYKNYLTNKQQLINDVQVSLDKAVDDYYTALAESTTLGLSLKGNASQTVLDEGGFLEQLTARIDSTTNTFSRMDEVFVDAPEGITVLRGIRADSMMNNHNKAHNRTGLESFSAQIETLNRDEDSTDITKFQFLTSKIMISINNDSLNMKEVDSLMKIELKRKNISVDYSLKFKEQNQDPRHFNDFDILTRENGTWSEKLLLTTVSKSTFLPTNSILSVQFTNETISVLKRIMGGILISTLLVLAVISCLFYLLGIIKRQKQLAEVKNDLISNITHEFKTPIATIGVALESIKNFKVLDDKKKTESYLDMSSEQLSKLNVMVEKLLETATLDSENLSLNKEETNINDLLNAVVSKHKLQNEEKNISLNESHEVILANIDAFHFENAINNLLDNAIKYGGDVISVHLDQNKINTLISVSDNGNTLTHSNKERIFEKFYRIPKGNTHDVKGFGIGLYYTKKIVEKHNGNILLDLTNKTTTFKISLPNE